MISQRRSGRHHHKSKSSSSELDGRFAWPDLRNLNSSLSEILWFPSLITGLVLIMGDWSPVPGLITLQSDSHLIVQCDPDTRPTCGHHTSSDQTRGGQRPSATPRSWYPPRHIKFSVRQFIQFLLSLDVFLLTMFAVDLQCCDCDYWLPLPGHVGADKWSELWLSLVINITLILPSPYQI